MLLAVESEGDQQMIGIGLANRNPAKEALRTFGRTIWSAGIGDHFPLGLTNILCLKPPVKHVIFIHVLLLKPPFSFRYFFEASVANAIESMQLQEWWVQNCIRTKYLVFVTGFKKSKENSRTPKTRRICWFAVVYPLCMHMHESQRKGTSVFLRPCRANICISRSPNLGRAVFRSRAMAKLAKLAKLDAAHHLKEDRTKNDLGKFPIKTGSGTPYLYDTWCLTLGLSFAA